MRIGGFQKLTLLDFPDAVACIVFTPGCDLRCPYCHNAVLAVPGGDAGEVPADEVMDYLKKRRGLLDGVVVSGGEPLLQPDLIDFIRDVRALGYRVKLDTNGTLPDGLEALLAAGLLDYVAMDVKHRPDAYALAAGPGAERFVPAVGRSMALLRASGVPFEFRTTFVRGIHAPEDAGAIAEWIAGDEPYFLQSYVDSGGVLDPEGLSAFSPEELQKMLADAKTHCPRAALRGV